MAAEFGATKDPVSYFASRNCCLSYLTLKCLTKRLASSDYHGIGASVIPPRSLCLRNICHLQSFSSAFAPISANSQGASRQPTPLPGDPLKSWFHPRRRHFPPYLTFPLLQPPLPALSAVCASLFTSSFSLPAFSFSLALLLPSSSRPKGHRLLVAWALCQSRTGRCHSSLLGFSRTDQGLLQVHLAGKSI